MAIHRLKRNFTAGELSPLLLAQVENDRYRFGCRTLRNMHVKPQGPASRREGFCFRFDLTPLLGTSNLQVRPRIVPFIFSETQAYAIIFYQHSSFKTRCVFASDDGLVEDPLSPGDPYVYEFTGTFSLATFTYKQSADILYIAQTARTPIEFKRLGVAEWQANECSFTDAPSDWNTTDGFPQFVDFYEQRIVYLSTKARPQTAWFSKSGDFYDFGKSSPIVASDAVTLTFDSGTQNKVQWTNAAKQLLVGTLGDEWAISGSGYEPLSFQSNRVARHTNNGGGRKPALRIGPVTLFIERHGRKVNQFIFDFNSDTYDTVDLSVLAPHLTEDEIIVAWDYQQTPHGIVWCVRRDGALLGLTFKREHKVTGWHRHDTDGEFLAVGCIPGDREDDIWVVVERTIGGLQKWYIEQKKPEFKSTSVLNAYFLDSHMVLESVTPVTELTGLDHLEGKTVGILADGCVVTSQLVTSGTINLDVAASKVVVGLEYESVLEPTLLDVPLNDGTILGRMVSVPRMDIMLNKSIGFEYGYVTEEGEEVFEGHPFRYPSHNTGEQIPLFTGLKQIDFPEGYTDELRVLIRQRSPLPLTVVCIIDNVEVYG